ncbi:MAG: YihY/virulence factor BrkB family protein [Pseudomonadota bacterium]
MGKIWQLIKMTANGWSDDYVSSMGAALAFYTLFSIAPMLLIVLSIAGFFFGLEAARGEIVGQLNHLMGEQGAVAVQALLQTVNQPQEGMIATIIGSVLLLVGATTVFGELQNSLDRIWCVPERAKINGIVALFRERILSFGIILGIGFILLVSLIFSAALSAISQMWSTDSSEWVTLLKILNIVFSFVMTTAMFAMIYKFMPSAKIAWGEVWLGALITAILFTVGKLLIGLYIGTSQIASGFGVAGSLVVLLVWVYYSAQVFLLGAEFTWAYSKTYGSRKAKISAKA